jgi:glycosyltransferase involved in cell wall biosynthesis
MPMFSIIIPTYKGERYLGIALSSLESQTFIDWEAVVVDDASGCASTERIIDAALKRDQRFRSVSLPHNIGPAAARNRGLSQASGDYVAFLDSDDVFLSWNLETIAEVINREHYPAFVAGSAVALYESEAPVVVCRDMLRYKLFPTFLDYRARYNNWWFNPSGAVIKRDLLVQTGGFWEERELFCEDIDLWLRLGDAACFIRIEAPVTYGYRLHDGSIHHRHAEMYNGLERIIRTERAGAYPGGSTFRKRRIAIVASHSRHHAREFLSQSPDFSWKLYRSTFFWNLRFLRCRFLIGLPLLAIIHKISSRR